MVDNFALVLTHALLALAAWRLLLRDGLDGDPEVKPKRKSPGPPAPDNSGNA